MFKSILVPIDFSPSARAACLTAFALAERFGAKVEIMHAWYTPEYISPKVALHAEGGPTTLEELMNKEAQRQLDEFMATVEVPKGLEVLTTFAFGLAADVIVAASGSHDLVVMGTHGRTGISRLVMGSVAERVIQGAKTPVMVVRSPG